MSQTIQISEETAALLTRQAAAHGMTVEAWIEELALQKAQTDATGLYRSSGSGNAERVEPAHRSLVEQMRELRSQIKPDPEGWTVRDYVDHGRR